MTQLELTTETPRPTPGAVPLSTQLATTPFLVGTALRAGVLTPADLDPTREAHRQGFLQFALEQPQTACPRPLLDAFEPDTLWTHLLRCPAVTAYLVEHLDRTDWSQGLPTSPRTGFPQLPDVHRALPGPLQECFLRILRAHYDPTLATHADLRGWFAEPLLTELKRLIRSAGARKAAVTRRSGTGVRAGDPIADALAHADADRFERFQIETMEAARLLPLLPAWVASTPAIRAHLLRTPLLPAEHYLTALNGWAARQYEHPRITFAHPVPVAQLLEAPAPTLLRVLETALLNETFLDRALSNEERERVLFVAALHDPGRTRTLQANWRLLAWHQTLKGLAHGSRHPQRIDPPTDPEARWVLAICQRPAQVTRAIALALADLFEGWAPARQLALVPALRHLNFRNLLAERA